MRSWFMILFGLVLISPGSLANQDILYNSANLDAKTGDYLAVDSDGDNTTFTVDDLLTSNTVIRLDSVGRALSQDNTFVGEPVALTRVVADALITIEVRYQAFGCLGPPPPAADRCREELDVKAGFLPSVTPNYNASTLPKVGELVTVPNSATFRQAVFTVDYVHQTQRSSPFLYVAFGDLEGALMNIMYYKVRVDYCATGVRSLVSFGKTFVTGSPTVTSGSCVSHSHKPASVSGLTRQCFALGGWVDVPGVYCECDYGFTEKIPPAASGAHNYVECVVGGSTTVATTPSTPSSVGSTTATSSQSSSAATPGNGLTPTTPTSSSGRPTTDGMSLLSLLCVGVLRAYLV